MKAVVILTTFDGYPDGKKRRFTEGREVFASHGLAEAYLDLLVAKGLAREKTEAAAAGARGKKDRTS